MIKKPSLIERLSNALGGSDQDDGDFFEDFSDQQGQIIDEHPDYAMPRRDAPQQQQDTRPMSAAIPARPQYPPQQQRPTIQTQSWGPEPEGELAVDVYQTDDAIMVKALVAGVAPQNIDIALTRDMVTIKGTREPEQPIPNENYYQQELFWGPFSRTILLPEEVDVDSSDASERHGILIITLPKVNKARQAKLKVRSK